MDDYISREKALQFRLVVNANRATVARGVAEAIAEYINAIPAADVQPVVYCRDCIHLGFKDFDGICNGPMCGIVKPWDYCSRGVRGGDT